MGDKGFRDYLALLGELTKTLGELAQVEQEKAAAVRADDLEGLNACMKKEQAMAMALRGYDQRREAMLAALNLTGVPLRELAMRAPEACRDDTKAAVEGLCRQYALFRGAAEVARDTLECNLHQIEKILASAGADIREQEAQIPSNLRTDFRA